MHTQVCRKIEWFFVHYARFGNRNTGILLQVKKKHNILWKLHALVSGERWSSVLGGRVAFSNSFIDQRKIRMTIVLMWSHLPPNSNAFHLNAACDVTAGIVTQNIESTQETSCACKPCSHTLDVHVHFKLILAARELWVDLAHSDVRMKTRLAVAPVAPLSSEASSTSLLARPTENFASGKVFQFVFGVSEKVNSSFERQHHVQRRAFTVYCVLCTLYCMGSSVKKSGLQLQVQSASFDFPISSETALSCILFQSRWNAAIFH